MQHVQSNFKFPRHWVYLGLGLGSFLIASFLFIHGGYGGGADSFTQFRFPFNVLLLLFLIGHFLFIQHITSIKKLYNVQQLWAVLAIGGLVTLLVNIIPDVLILLKLAGAGPTIFGNGYNLARYYFLITYFMVSLFLVRKLIFVKPTRSTDRIWKAFTIFLLVSLLWNINSFSYPVFFDYLFYAIGIAMASLLLLRIKWIAILSVSVKRQSIALLIVVNLVNLALLENYMNSAGSNPFNLVLSSQVFFFFMAGFASVYCVHSLFALFFNLPIASVADERKAEIDSLKQLGQIIEKKLSSEDIFSFFFEHSYKHSQAHAGWVIVYNEKGESVLTCQNISEKQGRHIALNISEKIEKHEESRQYTNQTRKRHPSVFTNIPEEYNSILIFPIIFERQELARIFLLSTFTSGFDEYNVKMVKGFGEQALIAYNNTLLLNKTLLNERIEEELAIAERIQSSLIPTDFPDLAFLDIFANSKTATKVGGDFYDYHVLDPNRIILMMGDVSGSGIPAALHMAEMKGIFQSLIQFDVSPVDFLSNSNRAVSACFEQNAFVALNYLFIDNDTRKFTYARAGNCPLLYFNAQEQTCTFLKDEGLGLGIVRNDSFSDHVFIYEQNFQEDDVLLLYTDGIIEATGNQGEEQFGMNRLKTCFSGLAESGSKNMVTEILAELNRFAHEKKLKDDVALMAIRFA